MRTGERASRPSRGGGRPPTIPPDQQIGRLRLVIAGLCAVILGLVIALLAGGGGDQTTTVTETVPDQATATTPTAPTTETDATDETTDETDSGGVTPGTDTDADTDIGGSDEELLPDPDIGDDTTEPSGGISPDG